MTIDCHIFHVNEFHSPSCCYSPEILYYYYILPPEPLILPITDSLSQHPDARSSISGILHTPTHLPLHPFFHPLVLLPQLMTESRASFIGRKLSIYLASHPSTAVTPGSPPLALVSLHFITFHEFIQYA